MKTLKDACIRLLSVFNYPYISDEMLKEIKGPILLHISDTPADIYNYIFRIIDILKPKYIIHTGDLVDNIKLGIHKNSIDIYYKEALKLIAKLEQNNFSTVYYTLGNHDNYEIVSKLSKRGIIIEDDCITIDGYNITVSHYHKELTQKQDFNLYGHSFKPKHYEKNGTIGLNGLLNINIIDLSSKRVFQLEYPINTNVSRRMELKRIGL